MQARAAAGVANDAAREVRDVYQGPLDSQPWRPVKLPPWCMWGRTIWVLQPTQSEP